LHNLAKDLAVWFSLDSESGVTAIEYGLVAALIALGIIAGGTQLAGIFNFFAPNVDAP
jgi:pilus assembly protein Flp/PilA